MRVRKTILCALLLVALIPRPKPVPVHRDGWLCRVSVFFCDSLWPSL